MMKEITNGDIFHSDMEIITVTVNLVGAMGKGLAAQAREKYPWLYRTYQDNLEIGNIEVGKPYITYGIDKSFCLFPTKRHWKNPSQLIDIEWGLQWMSHQNIKSIAIPPLGCGLGGQKWADVYPLIKKYTSKIPQVEIYLPQRRRK